MVSRFDKQIYLGVCETREEQLKILKAVTSKIPLDANISLDNVVLSLSFNLTGADFAALATDAFYIATRRVITRLNEDSNSDTKVEVTEYDLLEAAENLVPSVSFEELKMYKEIKSKSSNAGLLDL
ncbi:hypothetical protein Anas_00358 [Armadillidium nasatum]|uniref:Uncharacterized protein n=1 Tax=Armadillidium nasatum TaxID=96803 RepID=A0A5N5SL70_9CRUS|nr:hypothetical protein Anas_00358 [Armadillidium nasatum]